MRITLAPSASAANPINIDWPLPPQAPVPQTPYLTRGWVNNKPPIPRGLRHAKYSHRRGFKRGDL